jgi:hypothetical protein
MRTSRAQSVVTAEPSVTTYPYLRAFPLCACGSLKRYGTLACALCLSKIDRYPDFLDDCTDLERRLAHVHVVSAAEHAARAARRTTRRVNELATSIAAAVPAALWRGFAEDEAGRAGDCFGLCAMAVAWSVCLIALATVMRTPLLP